MAEILVPKIECKVESGEYGRFAVEPLEAGFGITLGNALRRVLLSSLSGTGIVTMKIEGVYHEFSTIPHVKEDVIELLLNVKQIRLRSFSDRPATLHLDVEGEGEVCAGDIMSPPEVEVVNPQLHLATLDSTQARLIMEFGVEHGKGYVPADHREDLPIGVIPVDAIFTPIRKVNYEVEHIRIGQETNYERLLLEIWTDGTVTPRQAVNQAAQMLSDRFKAMVEPDKTARRTEKPSWAMAPISTRDYERPIEELDLSVRAYNCLKRSGITKIGQILEMSPEELLAVRNFGRKSLDELRERLEAMDFVLSSVEMPGGASKDVQEEPADEEEEDPMSDTVDIR
ncbi:MAG: DNA-directed RNA polymerase subunit alpha [Chloroflexi bacterium]|nr:DNA-directed RNA polymerase subunit alpha [Chloroflexota bacterium]